MKANQTRTNERHAGDQPLVDRPRERLIELGASALNDAQILVILLRTGEKSVLALALAIFLIDKFGGFSGIESAFVSELCDLKGMGPAKAAIEVARRLGRDDTEGAKPVFHGGDNVYRFLSPTMGRLPHEEFPMLFRDTKHRLIREPPVSRGTSSGTAVDPREFSARRSESAQQPSFAATITRAATPLPRPRTEPWPPGLESLVGCSASPSSTT